MASLRHPDEEEFCDASWECALGGPLGVYGLCQGLLLGWVQARQRRIRYHHRKCLSHGVVGCILLLILKVGSVRALDHTRALLVGIPDKINSSKS